MSTTTISTITSGFIDTLEDVIVTNLPAVLVFVGLMIGLFLLIALVKRGFHGR